MSLTFHRILDLYGINLADTKLVRHSNSEIPILETFNSNLLKFESYQFFQGESRFSSAAHIAVFAPSQGTSALFLGVWDILGCTANSDIGSELHQLIDSYNFPINWHTDLCYYNSTERSENLGGLPPCWIV